MTGDAFTKFHSREKFHWESLNLLNLHFSQRNFKFIYVYKLYKTYYIDR